ncbi:uncharacterized protein [Rutidosis leptorrhynchoides]|uniref:uncharacterized protein n=1 Tax=Rutidosis leptorrhynchoides TaxID=125765 RepID=UPI003A9A5655
MPKGAGSAFITLILKVSNPAFIKDYRPISLISVTYKIITKILTSRLANVIDKVIGHEQTAFIANHQILDGPLILNETIGWYKKRKEKLMIFKIDFEKAYHSVRWDFLYYMLGLLGFGVKWRSWIHMCLYSARTSILINGSPTKEFLIKCGLLQGDPLSPFLFLIVMEDLNLCIKREIASGSSIGSGTVKVSHLLYADDAVIISKWSRDELAGMIRIFDSFFSWSGLSLTFLNRLFLVWEFQTWNSMNLFRLPTALKVLSRLTLIRMVLGSLGIYYLSLFKCPDSILNEIERLRAGFFWGSTSDIKKIHWISWNQTLASIDHGSLNVGSVRAFNFALLFKWVWRFVSSEDSNWCKVIRAIYGHQGGLDECYSNGSSTCNTLRVKIGNESSVKLWKYNWRGDGSLSTKYHRLYHLESNPDCCLSEHLVNGNWIWDWCRNDIGSRNEAYLHQMILEIGSPTIVNSIDDRWEWCISEDGIFNISSTRKSLDTILLPSTDVKFSWFNQVPRKVKVFFMESSLG